MTDVPALGGDPSGHLDTDGSAEQRARYRAYRTRQARALVRLLPDHAIRPLYRRALDDPLACERPDDPMGLLVAFCEKLLPLPPFEVWMRDATLHPVAHLQDLDDSADAPSAFAPTTVELRRFEYGDGLWIARLRSFRDGAAWRGFISFEERGSGRLQRTALIFRESDPATLRERFLSFDATALGAFLRSTLP